MSRLQAVGQTPQRSSTGRNALVVWAKRTCEAYGVAVRNLNKSWSDGRAFCAIVDRYAPGHIDFASLNSSEPEKNLELAFSVAERQLGVPPLLDASDVLEGPDDFSISAYLTEIYKKVEANVVVHGGLAQPGVARSAATPVRSHAIPSAAPYLQNTSNAQPSLTPAQATPSRLAPASTTNSAGRRRSSSTSLMTPHSHANARVRGTPPSQVLRRNAAQAASKQPTPLSPVSSTKDNVRTTLAPRVQAGRQSLEGVHAECDSERRALQQRVRELESASQENSRNAAKSHEQAEEARRELGTAQSEAEKWKKRADESDELVRSLRAKVKALEESIEKERKEHEIVLAAAERSRGEDSDGYERIIEECHREIEDYKGLTEMQEKMITDLNETLETQAKVLIEYETNKLTQGEANPSELSRAFKAAKNELAELKGELTKAQTELEGLRKAASEGASKEQVDQYDQRIRTEELNKALSERDEREKAIKDANEKAEQSAKELRETQLKIEDLERKLKKKNEETADLKEKASVLTENEERVKRKCDQALSEADALRHQLERVLEEQAKKDDDNHTQIRDLTEELENFKVEMNRSEQVNARLRHELSNSQHRDGEGMHLNEAEVERLRSLLRSARAQIHGLKFQLAHGARSFNTNPLEHEERESTTSLLALVARRLGLSEREAKDYVSKWSDAIGGKFCRNVARVRVLRESTGWGGVVLEMSPSHNLMVKAELEAVLKGRKEAAQVHPRVPAISVAGARRSTSQQTSPRRHYSAVTSSTPLSPPRGVHMTSSPARGLAPTHRTRRQTVSVPQGVRPADARVLPPNLWQ